MDALLAFAGKMQSNKVLSAVRNSFIDFMPVTITGSFAVLFRWIISQSGDVNGAKYLSLANVPGFGWLTALQPLWDTVNYGCINFIAVGMVVLISWHYCESLGRKNDKTAPMVALAVFITLMKTTASTDSGETVSNVVSSSYTASGGIFTSIIVGILATLMYVKIVESGKVNLKLPDSVPPNVAASFSVLFPSMIVIFIWGLVGWFFNAVVGTNFFDIISMCMQPLQAVVGSLPGMLFLCFLAMLFWWFGIHGANMISTITTPILTVNSQENLAVFFEEGTTKNLPHIFCSEFWSTFFAMTGSGITGGLIIAVLLFSKRDDYRAICKLAIPCGIFDINEPIIFGIPMVMNPIMAAPFFLAPLASVTVGYVLTAIGFCPRLCIGAPWTTPPGILGFLASGGNIMGGVAQLICLAVATLIYTPFVIAANHQASEEEA